MPRVFQTPQERKAQTDALPAFADLLQLEDDLFLLICDHARLMLPKSLVTLMAIFAMDED